MMSIGASDEIAINKRERPETESTKAFKFLLRFFRSFRTLLHDLLTESLKICSEKKVW